MESTIAANGKTNRRANATLTNALLTMADACTIVSTQVGDSGANAMKVTNYPATQLVLVKKNINKTDCRPLLNQMIGFSFCVLYF